MQNAETTSEAPWDEVEGPGNPDGARVYIVTPNAGGKSPARAKALEAILVALCPAGGSPRGVCLLPR